MTMTEGAAATAAADASTTPSSESKRARTMEAAGTTTTPGNGAASTTTPATTATNTATTGDNGNPKVTFAVEPSPPKPQPQSAPSSSSVTTSAPPPPQPTQQPAPAYSTTMPTSTISDVLEERLIDAEYKIWKKNTPYLYDLVMTHALEWPSLTCQWLPHVRPAPGGGGSGGGTGGETEEHSLLIGTHTTEGGGGGGGGAVGGGNPAEAGGDGAGGVVGGVEDDTNYLMVCGVHLPKVEGGDPVVATSPSTAATSNGGEKTKDGDAGEAKSPTSNGAGANTGNGDGEKGATTVLPASHYEEEKSEVGGFGFRSTAVTPDGTHNTSSETLLDGRIDVKMKICHDGEVNRARYCPANHFLVATKGPHPEVTVFDLSKHTSFPSAGDKTAHPQYVLRGHESEGYGLCWNPHTGGGTGADGDGEAAKKLQVLSGSEDGRVCLWDLESTPATSDGGGEAAQSSGTTATSSSSSSSMAKPVILDPISTFKGHTAGVEDVDWHRLDPNLIGSVGDDSAVMLWDVREKNSTKATKVVLGAHDGADIHSIAFHPAGNEFLLATGSADKTVALWDMRNLNSRLQTLKGHTDQVFQVSWSPFNEAILASCSADRRVNIWDLSRIGMEQTAEDAEDGPPELLFVHGGHTSKVSDFSWNAHSPWTIASVSEDNVLQVWQMAEEIYGEDDDDDDEGEEDELKENELE